MALTCTLDWNRFADLPLATATYYLDSTTYDQFRGTDLTDELRVGSCTVDSADGQWHTQRIGPFRSTGGYSWYKLVWNDVASLSGVVGPEAEDRLDMNGHFSGPVSGAGSPIPFPPIHNHHIHVGPSSDPRAPVTQQDFWPQCFVLGQRCPSTVFGAFIQHHGDEQCTVEEGGTDCMLHSYPEYTKPIAAPLKVYAELNDVRPAGSEPLEWFYQLSIRTVASPRGSAHVASPLSFHLAFNPNAFDLRTQLGTLMLGMVPPLEDSFFLFTGRMPFAGTLVPDLSIFHAHAAAFQEGFVFAASPAELGLGGRPLPLPLHQSIITADVGFANNSIFRRHLYEQLRKKNGDGRPIARPAQLVCNAVGRLERVGTTWYDRKPKLECTPWRFAAGTQYTVVALNGATGAQREDSFVGMKASDGGARYSFPQHNVPGFAYVADDHRSHGTAAACNAELDSLPPFVDATTMLRIVLNRGTPRSTVDEGERALLHVAFFVLWCITFPLAGLTYLLAFCVLPAVVCCTRRGRPWQLRRLLCAQALLLTATYLLATVISRSLPPVGMHTAGDNALLTSQPRYRDHLTTESAHASMHIYVSLALTALLAFIATRPSSRGQKLEAVSHVRRQREGTAGICAAIETSPMIAGCWQGTSMAEHSTETCVRARAELCAASSSLHSGRA